MLSIISKLLKAINSNHRNGEVAAGISMSLLLAFIPSNNLIWFVLLFVVLMLKVHVPTMFAFLGIFKLSTPLFDPFLDTIGIKIISIETIQMKIIDIYNIPFMFFTSLNNSLVIGGLVAGIILWVPVWFLSKFIIKLYRNKLLPKIKQSKFYKFYKKIPIVSKLTGKAVKGVNVFGVK